MSEPRILFVDDDPKVLSAIERQMGDDFDLETAAGPLEGIEAVKTDGPFAVVISDMRMPEMSGAEMLGKIRQIAPDTVRILLTGFADLASTIEAVNKGNIFRYLSKPCPMETLATAVNDGIRQYQLVTAEKELVEGTLRGSIKVLFDVLGMVNPIAFSRASRVKRIAMAVAEQLELENLWEIEIAAMMSALGCITLPKATLEKLLNGKPLAVAEKKGFEEHPAVAKSLLENIPRLENVANIVGFQEKHFDGGGVPKCQTKGEDIPLGARILKAALDFDTEEARSRDNVASFSLLKSNKEKYDPAVLDALDAVFEKLFAPETLSLNAVEIQIGMVLATDVKNKGGQLLIGRGQEITDSIRGILQRFANNNNIQEPIEVFERGSSNAVKSDEDPQEALMRAAAEQIAAQRAEVRRKAAAARNKA
ncbi:MAG: HD domain-containing phosphohydrolase [Planctomycetaceae bacterium]